MTLTRAAVMKFPLTVALLLLTLAGCNPAQTMPPLASSGAGASPAPAVGVKPGDRAPEIQLTDLDGKPLTGADLLAQQKPFVVYYFATW